MNNFPVPSLTPKQQLALYTLLGQQVKSYHRHYHMGDNTSVPAETARELLESVWYTLDAGGGLSPSDLLQDRLAAGQAILEQRLEDARRLHRLVEATAPEHQSQCHWETVHGLGEYLERYDHLHFAHRAPEELVYPLLVRIPEDLRGLDLARFYLNCLWRENQILQAFPEEALFRLDASLPPDYWEAPQNLCEQPLINALGRAILGQKPDSLILDTAGRQMLVRRLSDGAGPLLERAMETVCRTLELTDGAAEYCRALLPQLRPRLFAALPSGDLSQIFL